MANLTEVIAVKKKAEDIVKEKDVSYSDDGVISYFKEIIPFSKMIYFFKC